MANQDNNIIDLAKERKRQRTLKGASASSQSNKKAFKGPGGGGKKPAGKVAAYVQAAVLLGVIYLLMRSCGGGV